MDNHLLTSLGLCLRGGMLAVGEEPAEAAARAKDARVLLLASDAAEGTARRCAHFAEEGNCLWLRLPFTKAEIGRAVGRTSCAISALTDIGFAANWVQRLANEDPQQYGETAEKLAIKSKRAAERKAELRVHAARVRRGAVQRKASAAPPRRDAVPDTPAEERLPRQSARRFGDRNPRPPRDGKPSQRSPHSSRDSRPAFHADDTGRPPRSPDTPRGGRTGSAAAEKSGSAKGAWRPFPQERRRGKAPNPYAHSRPVKKGKGSGRKDGGR